MKKIILIAVIFLIGCGQPVGQRPSDARQFCLSKGYTEWNYPNYCIKRVDGTDTVTYFDELNEIVTW